MANRTCGLIVCVLLGAVLVGGCASPNTARFRIEPDEKSLKQRQDQIAAERRAAQEPFADWVDQDVELTDAQRRQVEADLDTAQRILVLIGGPRGYEASRSESSIRLEKQAPPGEPSWRTYARAFRQGPRVIIETWIDYDGTDDLAQAYAMREQLQFHRALLQQLGKRFPRRVVVDRAE